MRCRENPQRARVGWQATCVSPSRCNWEGEVVEFRKPVANQACAQSLRTRIAKSKKNATMKCYRLEPWTMRLVCCVLLAMGLNAFTVHGQLAPGVTVTFANDTAIVRWQGTSGIKYRVERSIDGGATWQGI